MLRCIPCCCLAVMFLLTGQPASAAWQAKEVSKTPGEGRIFHASADGTWMAGWVGQTDGTLKLMVFSTVKGDKQEVDTAAAAGGMSWIPGINQLLYCKPTYNKVVDVTRVTYYLYDPRTKSKKKAGEINDKADAYAMDPIAAEDGSRVFHMTIDPSLQLPAFSLYFPAENRMKSPVVKANVSSLYDYSADGNSLFWWLRDPASNSLNLVIWNMDTQRYSDVLSFDRKLDPSEDWGMLRVDAPNKQAAISAYSESNPNLQVVVYYYGTPKNLYTRPIIMGSGEEVTYFDWKGRSGNLYLIVNYKKLKQFGIEEVDPTTGQRTPIYRGPDVIDYVDYSATGQAYYFSIVENAGTRKAQTRLIRVMQ